MAWGDKYKPKSLGGQGKRYKPRKRKATGSEKRFAAAHGYTPPKSTALPGKRGGPRPLPFPRTPRSVAPGYKIPTSGVLRKAGVRSITTPYNTPAGETTALLGGLSGINPPTSKALDPDIRRTSKKLAHEYVREHEGIREDPVAALVIDTIATAGLASTARLALATKDAAAASKAIAAAKAAGAGDAVKGAQTIRAALKQGRQARKAVRRAKIAERGGGGLKNLPTRVKTAPKRNVRKLRATPAQTAADLRALGTQAGRRKAARGVTQNVGAKAFKSPAYIPAAAAGQEATGESAPGAAIGPGLVRSFKSPGDAWKTTKTTGRALPGVITAPAALAYEGVNAIVKGDPRYFTETAKAQTKGVEEILQHTLSSDPAVVQKAIQEEGALSLLAGVPFLSRVPKFQRARAAVRERGASAVMKAADKGKVRRGVARVERKVLGPTQRSARKRIALHMERADKPHSIRERQLESKLTKELAKAPRGAGDAISTLLEFGIRDMQGVDTVRRRGGERGLVGETPANGGTNLRRALDFVGENPGIFQSKAFQTALKTAEETSSTTPLSLAAEHLGERARVGPQARLLDELDPQDMVPPAARPHTQAKNREEAWRDVEGRKKTAKQLRREAKAQVQQAKRQLEPARRQTLRAMASEAEARGASQVRVAAGDRQILRGDEAYVNAVKAANKASKELVSARKEFGNIARTRVARYGDEPIPGMKEKLAQAELDVHHTQMHLERVKDDVLRRADLEASKAARGEQASPLAQLSRGPAGSLRQLERKGGRTNELQVRERQIAEQIGRAREEATAKLEKARAVDQSARDLYRELDSYTRPGQKIGQVRSQKRWVERGTSPNPIAISRDGKKELIETTRKPFDDEMVAEHVVRVDERAGKELGLSRGYWTHHAELDRERGAGMEQSLMPQRPSAPHRREQGEEGGLAYGDRVDRSLRGFINGTIRVPLRRQAFHDFMARVVEGERKIVNIDGKPKAALTDQEWKQVTSPRSESNPNGGQLDPAIYGRLPLKEMRRTLENPTVKIGEVDDLLAAAQEGAVPGTTLSAPLERAAIQEMRAQIQRDIGKVKGGISDVFNTTSRVANRTILGTNPAWAISQIPAEGFPLLIAHPEIAVKAPGLHRSLKQWENASAENAAMASYLRGAAGATGKQRLATPRDVQDSLLPQISDLAKEADALTPGRLKRAAQATIRLKPLGLFDVARQGEFRTLLLLNQADKRFLGLANGVQGMFLKERELSHRFQGKTRDELYTWLTTTREGRRELDELANYVDDIQGNWGAFTSREKEWAPLTMFYPFLRYSLKWPLWTFPKQHPIKATILNMYAQSNANQLEELLGGELGPLSSPFQYAKPVVQNAEGEPYVLPGGTRISPGQSVLQTTAMSEEPGQLLQAANPLAQAVVTGLTGKTAFGQDVGDTLPQRLGGIGLQALGLSTPTRLGLETGPGRKVKEKLTGKPQSIIAEAFRRLDPSKGLRSAVLPVAPQSGRNAQLTERLSQALDDVSDNSDSKRDDAAYRGASARTIQKMELKATRAQQAIKRILEIVGLSKEDQRAYADFLARRYGGGRGGSSNIYSGSSTTGSGIDYGSITGGGTGSGIDYGSVIGGG